MPVSSPEAGHAGAADLAACREAIRHGSRSFFAASMLLPRRVRAPAFGLYAFCRLSDDEVDIAGGGEGAIGRLRDRLDRAYSGRPAAAPADRMLADLVVRYAIPRAVPEALIEGLEWDVKGRRFQDLSELQAYCARVAGTVGVMMTLIMGRRAPEALARASDLGVAMQITNIVRDVGEDARNGRLYLPLAMLRTAGIDPDAWLAHPVLDERLRSVLNHLLGVADHLYGRAANGVALLPADCRPAIHAARLIYAEIGREAERAGLDVLTRRARVSGARKCSLLVSALVASLWPNPRDVPVRELREVTFLLDAVSLAEPRTSTAGRGAGPLWWDVSGRFGRVLDIFERLQQREQYGR
jgi:phytoene synthase